MFKNMEKQNFNMKILILRTFAHNRIWEQENHHCEYGPNQWIGMIDQWEPNYTEFELGEFDNKRPKSICKPI